MCGRYTLTQAPERVAKQFNLSEVPELSPRYNIAPTQGIAIVRETGREIVRETGRETGREMDAERQLQLVHWGLIPSWAKDPKMGARMINARAETAAEKPSFRHAMRRRRCLVVADGFYEWQRTKEGKQPFFFYVPDAEGGRSPFAFAGLWEEWESAEGEVIQSATILTTEANERVQPIHDRMPVILPAEHYARWLDPDCQQPAKVADLLRPFPAEQMADFAVSTAVNNPRQDQPELLEAIAPN